MADRYKRMLPKSNRTVKHRFNKMTPSTKRGVSTAELKLH